MGWTSSGREKITMCSEVIRYTAEEIKKSPREKRARKAQFFMVWRSELRIAMKEKNVTYSKLADLSGKHKSVVTRFFGGGDARLSTLLDLSEALGMKWEAPKLNKIEDVFVEKDKRTGCVRLLERPSAVALKLEINFVPDWGKISNFTSGNDKETIAELIRPEFSVYD